MSGHEDYSAAANFEAYAKANVGLSWAIGATIIVSPIDMRGLIGMAQVLAALQTRLGRIDANSFGLVAQRGRVEKNITSDEKMLQALLGSRIGSLPLPLALAWLRKTQSYYSVAPDPH